MTLKTQLQQIDGITAVLLVYLYGCGTCLFFVGESYVLMGALIWLIGFAILSIYYSRSHYEIKKNYN